MRNGRIVHSLPTRPPRKGHVGQSRKVAVSRPGRSLTRSGGLAVTHLRGGASSRPWSPLSSRRLQGPGSRMVFFLFPVGRGFSFVFLQPRVICSYSLGWKAARFLKQTLLFSSSRDEPGRGLVSPFSPPPEPGPPSLISVLPQYWGFLVSADEDCVEAPTCRHDPAVCLRHQSVNFRPLGYFSSLTDSRKVMTLWMICLFSSEWESPSLQLSTF